MINHLEETLSERRRRIDKELERSMNRAMIPLMLPMTIAAGALLGLLISHVAFTPLPIPFVGWFMLVAVAVDFTPLTFAVFKYR